MATSDRLTQHFAVGITLKVERKIASPSITKQFLTVWWLQLAPFLEEYTLKMAKLYYFYFTFLRLTLLCHPFTLTMNYSRLHKQFASLTDIIHFAT